LINYPLHNPYIPLKISTQNQLAIKKYVALCKMASMKKVVAQNITDTVCGILSVQVAAKK